MPSSNVCWGIEIGAGGIKALKLEAAGENVKVLDFVVVPHLKVLSTPGIDQNDALRVTLGQFASQVDLTGASVAISVPGHSAFARFAKLPPVEPKKVPDIVKFEAVQQIPFPIDQVEWDYQTFKAPDSPDVEVGIFAITRDRIMERLALYQDVGITPDYVTLSPVAAYNAMAFDLAFTEKTPGTIVLDIGTTSTDLVIAEAGRVWIRTFPIGGHHFTEALVNAFQLSYPKAEKLKREAESSKHARHIFQAMRPVFGDLAQDVQRSIGYYQSLHKDAKLERLIGLGSTFRLPGLRKYLKQQVGMDVFRMEQFKRVSVDGPRAGEFQAQTLALATAYGLALQGLDMATLRANLMPVGVIRDAMWKRKVKWFGIAAGVAIAASGAMFIRPFLDNTEVANNPRPKIVSDVVSQGNSLKAEASDVISAASENATTAEVLKLAEGRDLFPRIVDDVGQLIAHAQSKASLQERPALQVTKLDALYQGAPAIDPNNPPPPPPPPAEGAAPEPDLTQQPRIAVTLKVTTNEPDPRRFAIEVVDAWLKQNAKRDGVPYRILNSKWTTTEVAAAAAPSTPTGSRGASPSASMGEGGGITPRGGKSGAGGPSQPPPIAIITGGSSIAGGPSPSGAPRESGPAPNIEEVRQLAQLPGAPDEDPSLKKSVLTITWEAVILPPQQAQPQGGTQ